MTWLRLSPVDAWFFRDGRPYAQRETAQSSVTSLFPPSPLTVSGALRAALARANGWDGRPNGWTKQHLDALGNGPEETGQLSFRGPFLSRGDDVLVSAPLHLLVRGKDQFALLAPGDPVDCDLGDAVHLPELSPADRQHDDWKLSHSSFTTTAGLARISAGGLPGVGDLVAANCLWKLEPRTALERDAAKHTTGDEGDLYSPAYVRVGRGISLAVEVRGEPSSWQWPELLPFGGESRMASLEQMTQSPALRAPESMMTNPIVAEELAVLCLTLLRLPLRYGVPIQPQLGPGLFKALGVEGVDLISACTGRSIMLGGWDSQAPRPLPLRPCLPAGTVLFCRATEDARKRLRTLLADGLGLDARLGFNQFTLGVWPRV